MMEVGIEMAVRIIRTRVRVLPFIDLNISSMVGGIKCLLEE